MKNVGGFLGFLSEPAQRSILNKVSTYSLQISKCHELKTLEWDILNPDLLINPEINNMRRTSNFNLEIKKKRRSSIDIGFHHSKFSSTENTFVKLLKNVYNVSQ